MAGLIKSLNITDAILSGFTVPRAIHLYLLVDYMSYACHCASFVVIAHGELLIIII